MTAYDETDANKIFKRREGELEQCIVHMTSLANSDTFDATNLAAGRKIIDVKAIDHAATVVFGATTAASKNEWECSLVVSTDVVTFSNHSQSTDAYIQFLFAPDPS